MPEIHPPTALVPTGDHVADLLAACVSLLTADAQVGVNQARGVKTVEVGWDQPEEPRRRVLRKDQLPAILLMASLGDVGTPVLCGVNTDTVRITVQVITRGGNNQTARALCLAIQARALALLQAEKNGGERFVDGYEIDPNVLSNAPGEPRISPWDRHEFISESTTDFGVLWKGAE